MPHFRLASRFSVVTEIIKNLRVNNPLHRPRGGTRFILTVWLCSPTVGAMGLRQRLAGAKIRLRLLDVLGNKCAVCSTGECLEMDCIIPCGDEHHRMSSCDRAFFYQKQFRCQNLQLLCSRCHQRKTAGDLIVLSLQPF